MNFFRRRPTTPNPRILTLDRGKKNADAHEHAGEYIGDTTHVFTFNGRTYPVAINEPENAIADNVADLLHRLADQIITTYGHANAA